MTRDIVLTGDGSHTLKLPGEDEHYHSTYGAMAESVHVFIGAGLKHVMDRDMPMLRILEVGMGTGLNVILSLVETMAHSIKVRYDALEPVPLDEETWRRLNYPEMLGKQLYGSWFEIIHAGSPEKDIAVTDSFVLHKHETSLQQFDAGGKRFDLVYFDAFGPEVQSELWTEEIFARLFSMTDAGGVLVTYSAKGSVRRALQSCGFLVERLPGPKGKREMMRAVRT